MMAERFELIDFDDLMGIQHAAPDEDCQQTIMLQRRGSI